MNNGRTPEAVAQNRPRQRASAYCPPWPSRCSPLLTGPPEPWSGCTDGFATRDLGLRSRGVFRRCTAKEGGRNPLRPSIFLGGAYIPAGEGGSVTVSSKVSGLRALGCGSADTVARERLLDDDTKTCACGVRVGRVRASGRRSAGRVGPMYVFMRFVTMPTSRLKLSCRWRDWVDGGDDLCIRVRVVKHQPVTGKRTC